tara:strand:- start:1970 stop:2263 length:294 start_codon:yes stop_codon:yes gene_type:complete
MPKSVHPTDKIQTGKKPAASELVPLGTYLKSVEDFYILESLKVIRLKKSWNVNSATIAWRDACLAEWKSRYGKRKPPDVELSQEVKDQIEFENSNYY